MKEYLKCCSTWAVSYLLNVVILELLVKFAIKKCICVSVYINIFSFCSNLCFVQIFCIQSKKNRLIYMCLMKGGIYMGNMLTVGRALGVNNVSELQKLRRLVRSENTGRVQAHFEFNHEILDAFISSRLGQSRGVSLSSIFERFFPKSFFRNSTNIY